MSRVGLRISLAAMLAAGAATVAIAQVPPPSPAEAARQAAIRAEYDKLPDSPGTGRYPALKEVDATLPDHVVYRPADLAKLGTTKLAVLVWGNGGCAADGASARQHLEEIASHGYLAIAPGRILSGPGAPPVALPSPTEPKPLGVKTDHTQVASAIDWAIAENGRKGSRYYGRIDTKAIAVSGHSCGGLQALQVAGDPRIRAVIIHNSGVFADGSNPIRGMTVDKSLLKTLHTPVLYVLGGPTDVAFPNGSDDFAKIDHVPAMLINLQVGHGGTFREVNGGRVAQIDVAWLDWQLRGDKTAALRFTGKDCGLCTDPQWTVERKKID